MNSLPVRSVVIRAAAMGSLAAFAIMGAVAIRAAWAITKGGRWYQVRQLVGF